MYSSAASVHSPFFLNSFTQPSPTSSKVTAQLEQPLGTSFPNATPRHQVTRSSTYTHFALSTCCRVAESLGQIARSRSQASRDGYLRAVHQEYSGASRSVFVPCSVFVIGGIINGHLFPSSLSTHPATVGDKRYQPTSASAAAWREFIIQTVPGGGRLEQIHRDRVT